MEELKKAFEPVKANFEAGVVSLNAIVVKIDAKFKEIESNESEVANLTGEVSKLKKLLEQTERQRDEMRQGMLNADKDLADGARRAAQQREELEAKVKSDIAIANEANSAIQKRMREMQAENQSLKAENARVLALYDECKDHPAVIASKIEQIEREKRKRSDEAEAKIKELRSKLKEPEGVADLGAPQDTAVAIL